MDQNEKQLMELCQRCEKPFEKGWYDLKFLTEEWDEFSLVDKEMADGFCEKYHERLSKLVREVYNNWKEINEGKDDKLT